MSTFGQLKIRLPSKKYTKLILKYLFHLVPISHPYSKKYWACLFSPNLSQFCSILHQTEMTSPVSCFLFLGYFVVVFNAFCFCCNLDSNSRHLHQSRQHCQEVRFWPKVGKKNGKYPVLFWSHFNMVWLDEPKRIVIYIVIFDPFLVNLTHILDNSDNPHCCDARLNIVGSVVYVLALGYLSCISPTLWNLCRYGLTVYLHVLLLVI